MNEIVFVVEDAPGGGYTARALGESMFTEADSLEALRRLAMTRAVEFQPVLGHAWRFSFAPWRSFL